MVRLTRVLQSDRSKASKTAGCPLIMAPFHTRFAPSPTGPLHRGHIYAAQIAHHYARHSGGKFTLRIDNIDHTRCRNQFIMAIFDDLNWNIETGVIVPLEITIAFLNKPIYY